jgi:SOS-response transcriptional repressor LexA
MSIGKGIGKNKKGLTPKQLQFLVKIKAFIKANSYSPSYEEIKQMTGMKSKSNVHAYVQSLKKRGYIDDIPYSKRSIVVLP